MQIEKPLMKENEMLLMFHDPNQQIPHSAVPQKPRRTASTGGEKERSVNITGCLKFGISSFFPLFEEILIGKTC